jgi:hypothetical protein
MLFAVYAQLCLHASHTGIVRSPQPRRAEGVALYLCTQGVKFCSEAGGWEGEQNNVRAKVQTLPPTT